MQISSVIRAGLLEGIRYKAGKRSNTVVLHSKKCHL